MSKSVRRIVGVVAAIAVPFAAPAIASAIGLSAGISGALGVSAAVGSTLGGALTGAVLGGAASKLQGGKFGQGALFGGVGGGIGGYMQAANAAASAANVAPGAAQAAPGSGVLLNAPGATAPTSIADMAAGLKMAPGAGVMAAPTTAAATPGFLANAATIAPGAASAVTPALANAPGVLQQTMSNVRNFTGFGNAATGAAPAAAGGAAGTGSWLKPALVQSGVNLAAGALAGPSAAEKELMRQQTESLKTATAMNQAAYQERLNEARKLIGESAYYDPEYAGLQAARRAQTAGARAKREKLRGLTGGERQAEERRYDLGIARDTGTAYDVGYNTGIANRLSTRQAGLAAFPTNYPDATSSYANLMSGYASAEKAAADRASQIGTFAGDLYGAYTGTSLGNPTKKG